MQYCIPLTTSFLFLAVMWKSGVAELRSADPALTIIDEDIDIAVGTEDVASSSGWSNNPMSPYIPANEFGRGVDRGSPGDNGSGSGGNGSNPPGNNNRGDGTPGSVVIRVY